MNVLQAVAKAIWHETYRHDTLMEWSEIGRGTLHHKRTMAAARAAMTANGGGEEGAIWLPIPGFPRYEASDRGQIRRSELPDGTPIFHTLKPYQSRATGHLMVSVYCEGKQFRRGVHRLVCRTFHGPAPEGKPLACHNNGDPGDCRSENLRWGSHRDNTADALKHKMHDRTRRARGENLRTFTKVTERPL